MKARARTLTLVLALLMVATLFVGCTGDTAATPTSTPAETPTSGDASGSPGGEEPGAWPAAELPAQTRPIKHYTRNMSRDNKPDDQEVYDKIHESTGIDIDIVTIVDYKPQMQLKISGQEEFDSLDLISMGTHAWSLLQKSNSIVPLNDLLDEFGPNVKKVMKDAMYMGTDFNGVIWALSRQEEFAPGFVPTYREDWRKKLNLAVPDTWANLEDMMEAFLTQDPNGNGQATKVNDAITQTPDEWANVPSWNLGGVYQNWGVPMLGFYANSNRWCDKENKIVKNRAQSPYHYEFVERLSRWYKEGWLYPMFHNMPGSDITPLNEGGKIGVTSGWYPAGTGQILKIRQIEPDVEFKAVPNIKDSRLAAWGSNPVNDQQVALSATGSAENHKLLIAYLDWVLASPENLAIAQWGIEGKHWDWIEKGKKVQLVLSNTDKYNMEWTVMELFFPSIMPKFQYHEDEVVGTARLVLCDEIRRMQTMPEVDAMVPYTDIGTAAETLTGDGQTLLTEGVTNMILGTKPLSDHDALIQEYIEIEGRIRSEVWTAQYNAYLDAHE